MAGRRLRRQDYTVGWVCALPFELAAAQEMLDEEHQDLPQNYNDTNIYTLGRISEHNIVIACLPEGQTGTNSAASVAVQMKSVFTSIQFGLMVGIGGSVPSVETDIRLGDVVISGPHKLHGGVVQYDFGKATLSGFERTGFLNTPPTILLNAVAKLQASHLRRRSRLSEYVSKLNGLPMFAREDAGPDVLFEADYDHVGGAACDLCRKERVLERPSRGGQQIMIHCGTIASGNQVMRDAAERDRVSSALGGVLCFEMEAAGLMNIFPCLVIRGICDYADSHKNKRWQAYAAGTAAACAKGILTIIPVADVARTDTVNEALTKNSSALGRRRKKRMEQAKVEEDSSSDSTGDESGNLQCFSCQEYGHFAKSCPNNACYNCLREQAVLEVTMPTHALGDRGIVTDVEFGDITQIHAGCRSKTVKAAFSVLQGKRNGQVW